MSVFCQRRIVTFAADILSEGYHQNGLDITITQEAFKLSCLELAQNIDALKYAAANQAESI